MSFWLRPQKNTLDQHAPHSKANACVPSIYGVVYSSGKLPLKRAGPFYEILSLLSLSYKLEQSPVIHQLHFTVYHAIAGTMNKIINYASGMFEYKLIKIYNE